MPDSSCPLRLSVEVDVSHATALQCTTLGAGGPIRHLTEGLVGTDMQGLYPMYENKKLLSFRWVVIIYGITSGAIRNVYE